MIPFHYRPRELILTFCGCSIYYMSRTEAEVKSDAMGFASSVLLMVALEMDVNLSPICAACRNMQRNLRCKAGQDIGQTATRWDQTPRGDALLKYLCASFESVSLSESLGMDITD